ncbi:MAG TPA: c-type cytochrome [Guyparkeria sp.]|nr:c-type cytochrome [Guyparkeria sp.]
MTRYKAIGWAAVLGGSLWLTTAQAEGSRNADPQALMAAQTCAGCHGTEGYIENSAYVPLAGMPREQFIQAMNTFADGSRPSTLMGPLARAFTDEEISAMADYFASMPRERAKADNAGGDDS